MEAIHRAENAIQRVIWLKDVDAASEVAEYLHALIDKEIKEKRMTEHQQETT